MNKSRPREAITLARTLHPDVVLMDVRMPVVDGIEATRRVLAHADPPRVIMLTTFDRNEYVYEAMKAGASANGRVPLRFALGPRVGRSIA